MSLGCTFHEVRGDVCDDVVSGGRAGPRMPEAETRLAAFWVHFSEVVEAWLAPAQEQAQARARAGEATEAHRLMATCGCR